VAFGVTSSIQDEYGNDHRNRFKGLIRKYPLMTIIMSVALFSLAGLPPLSGFIAKFNIFTALVSKGYYTLAVVAALNSVVGLYYYMKLVRIMTLDQVESEQKLESFTFVRQLTLTIIAIPIVLLGIFWSQIMVLAQSGRIFVNL